MKTYGRRARIYPALLVLLGLGAFFYAGWASRTQYGGTPASHLRPGMEVRVEVPTGEYLPRQNEPEPTPIHVVKTFEVRRVGSSGGNAKPGEKTWYVDDPVSGERVCLVERD